MSYSNTAVSLIFAVISLIASLIGGYDIISIWLAIVISINVIGGYVVELAHNIN